MRFATLRQFKTLSMSSFILILFLFAKSINTFSKCCVGAKKKKKREKENERKEKKIANYRIEARRRVLISTPLHQAGAGTIVT
jgi:hypothetical protein